MKTPDLPEEKASAPDQANSTPFALDEEILAELAYDRLAEPGRLCAGCGCGFSPKRQPTIVIAEKTDDDITQTALFPVCSRCCGRLKVDRGLLKRACENWPARLLTTIGAPADKTGAAK